MIDPIDHLSEPTKHAIDAFSALTVIATLAQILPAVASLLTIIWMALRIFETDTVRGWTGRNKP